MNIKKYVAIFLVTILLSFDVLGLYSEVVQAATEEIKSIEYYIHDNYIERVYPKTDIEDFKKHLGRDVVVYTDQTKKEEVTSRNSKDGDVGCDTRR